MMIPTIEITEQDTIIMNHFLLEIEGLVVQSRSQTVGVEYDGGGPVEAA